MIDEAARAAGRVVVDAPAAAATDGRAAGARDVAVRPLAADRVVAAVTAVVAARVVVAAREAVVAAREGVGRLPERAVAEGSVAGRSRDVRRCASC